MGHPLLLPYDLSAWGYFPAPFLPVPRSLDGGQTRDYYQVLPSGLQAICLRAVIFDRWRESDRLAGAANSLAVSSFAAERLEIPTRCFDLEGI